MKITKRCDILVRRSLEDNTKNISLEYQEKLCRQKAAEEGYEVAKVFTEQVSAYNTSMENRPVLQKILNRISNGETKALICWQKSRLVRDMAEEVILQKIIVEDSNCKVLFADPTEIPMDGNSMNKLLNVIRGWQNETEVETLRHRIKDHIRSRAKDGIYVGGTYTGLRWSKDEKRMVHVPGEIETVKKIFNLYLYEGYSTKQIADHLNERDIKTRTGKKFYPYTVCSILQCKIYCGYYRWGFTTSKRRDKPIAAEGFENKVNWVEPIITIEEWKKVQKIMIDRSRKKRGQKRDYSRTSSTYFLLSGKVVCGECGKIMAAHNGSRKYVDKSGIEKTSLYLRYVCRNSSIKHSNSKTIDSTLLDDNVRRNVIQFVKSSNMEILLSKAEEQLQKYKEEINAEILSIDKRMVSIKKELEIIKKNLVQTTHPEMVKFYEDEFVTKGDEIVKIEDEKMKLNKGINKLKITENDFNEFFNLLDSFKGENDFPRSKLIRLFDSLVDRVIINGTNVDIKLKWSIAFDKESSNTKNTDLIYSLPSKI